MKETITLYIKGLSLCYRGAWT